MVRFSVCIEMLFSDDPVVQRIERCGSVGVAGFEFWGRGDKDLDTVVDAATENDVSFVGMVGSGSSMVDPEGVEAAVADLRESIRVADDVGCPTLIVTVGQEIEEYDRQTQHETIVECLSRVASDAEEADVTLVVEPLNTAVNHPGYFLESSYEGYEIVEAVDSPAVKLLFDIYHQQISEGNIIENMTEHLDHIGHVHIADVPGRHEPGTGELNYERIFAALDDAGYDGYVGMEFSSTVDDEEAIRSVQSLA